MLAKQLTYLAGADGRGHRARRARADRADVARGQRPHAARVRRGHGARRARPAREAAAEGLTRGRRDGRRDPRPQRRLVEPQVRAVRRRGRRAGARPARPARRARHQHALRRPRMPAAPRSRERSWYRALGHDGAMAHLVLLPAPDRSTGTTLRAVGHRVVHGGMRYSAAGARRRRACVAYLETLVPLAPLHQPHNLRRSARCSRACRRCRRSRASTPSFHRSACPRSRRRSRCRARSPTSGVRRYGFHGLSYEYIASVLPGVDAEAAPRPRRGRAPGQRRVDVRDARVRERRVDDGLHRGRRPDDGHALPARSIPGVLLYLMDELQHGRARDREAALPGVRPARRVGRVERHARRCSRATTRARAMPSTSSATGSRASSARSPPRSAASTPSCSPAASASTRRRSARASSRRAPGSASSLDAAANAADGPRISGPGSARAWVVPTNEELMIARHTQALLA